MTFGFVRATTEDGEHPYFNSFHGSGGMFEHYYGTQDVRDTITKTAGAMTLTAGAWNAIFGPKLTNLQYWSKNAFSAIGAKPWASSGIRVQKTMATSGGIGVARGANLPAQVRGDFAHVTIPYKELPFTFAMSLGDIQLKGKDDIVTWEQFLELQEQAYVNGIDADLLGKVETAPTGFGVEEYRIDKLDRVISSYAEAVALTLTAGYESPWGGADSGLYAYRNASTGGASNFDCYTDVNGGATRVLELSLVDGMFANTMPYWDSNNNKVMITGYDTLAKLAAILQPQQRYEGFVNAEVTIEGVKTLPGRDTGYRVSTYNDVPIIPDKNTATDTISRIYLVDKDYLHYNMLIPQMIRVSDNPLVTGSLKNAAVLFQLGELWCNKFKGQGKITYLK